MTDNQVRWMRWAVRGALVLGVAASVTANVLHAPDNPISQAISAWPPLALLITVELVSRVPVYRKGLGAVRLLATAAIAGIAAYISYWHMVEVVARYGEKGAVPYLLPLSVDGLIIVASVSLVELAGRTDASSRPTPATEKATRPAPELFGEASATFSTQLAVPITGLPTVASSDNTPPKSKPSDQAVPTVSFGLADTDLGDAPQPADDAASDENEEGGGDKDMRGIELAAELVALLPAARIARDELIHEGRTVSRDALAHRLRSNGHAIRNNRVSELLNALRQEEPSANGARPTVSA